MTNIIKKIVSTGNGSLFKSPNPIYFAVHSTANPGATAANHVNYWTNNPRYAVHLVSDWKEAYQCVDFKYVCNQVGNGNRTCIGLEICEAKTEEDFRKGISIARSVILQVLKQYNWDIDNHVRSHKWFTENYGGSDHVDPIPYFRKYGWDWNKFINFLKDGKDEIVTEEDIIRFSQEVWNRGIQLPNGKWKESGKVLGEIYAEEMRTDDPTGRNALLKDHDHIKWIAKTVTEQGEKIDKILELLEKQV